MLSKTERQIGLRRARRDGWLKRDVANQLGTTADNLSKIISRGSKRSIYGISLDQWLNENGYLKDNDVDLIKKANLLLEFPKGEDKDLPDIVKMLTVEMRVLIEVLLNHNLPSRIKGQRFASFIEGYHKSLDEYLEAFNNIDIKPEED